MSYSPEQYESAAGKLESGVLDAVTVARMLRYAATLRQQAARVDAISDLIQQCEQDPRDYTLNRHIANVLTAALSAQPAPVDRGCVYVCSNPACGAVHATDQNGHCPACIKPDGTGWSTLPRKYFGECPACAACSPYLKEGETPAKRIEREFRDCASAVELLRQEREKTAALSAQHAERQGKVLSWALRQGGVLADWCNVAGAALRALMGAYERRVRSDCGLDDLAKEPWRCAEYVQAEQALRSKPAPVVDFTHPAAPVGVPDGEVRLWDTQWMNIVNHDNCYRGWDKTDAINHAVKMTEQAIARNVADGKLPPPRLAAAPSAPQGVER